MSSSLHSIPELLAPAGDLATALTAYENGADAVYAGLGRFNAREMAHNFSTEDMSRLSTYAKKKGKKYYLAFNTLIKESELEEAAKSLDKAASLEPDGIIVQDLGVAALIREAYPRIEVHGSTQMGIHNAEGVKAAAAMGISRVIMERQVTLEELNTIVRESPIEIEVFIHGALCCSLSGRCLFSSWIGGWSGNRGKCKQPCRRRYHSKEDKTKSEASGFFFSTQDLYSLDLLKELIETGVSSLKIEGRLKKGSYIKPVVRAYRMELDALAEGRGSELSKAKNVLSDALGRKWTHGFASKEDMNQVVQHASLGVSGLLIGEVQGRSSVKDIPFVKINLKRPLFVGDRIRIQSRGGEESPSITVTKLLKEGLYVKKAKSGTVMVADRGEAPSGGIVYKVGKSQKEEGPAAENLPLFTPKISVDLEIEVSPDQIQARFKRKEYSRWWKQNLLTEPAKNRALSKEEVAEAFSSTRSERVKAGKITAACAENLFVPAKELKRVRREFWQWAIERIENSEDFSSKTVSPGQLYIRNHAAAVRKEGAGAPGGTKTVVTCIPEDLIAKGFTPPGKSGADGFTEKNCTRTALPIQDLCSQPEDPHLWKNFSEMEALLPHFTPQKEISKLEELIHLCYKRGIRRFRLSDLAHLSLFKKSGYKDVELSTGYPFPVTNSIASAELKNFDVHRVQAWVELEKQALEDFADKNPVRTEIYRYGRPFLLVTRAHIAAEGLINDPRGRKFIVLKRGLRFSGAEAPESGEAAGVAGCGDRKEAKDERTNTDADLTYLYPYEVLSLPGISGCDGFYDNSTVQKMEREGGIEKRVESTFNFNLELV
ncbi:MAG: peptidase U32 family protein [Spirochaetaceae bacterium]